MQCWPPSPSIVPRASMEGYAANPIAVAYGASTAALKHLTVSMANEWASWGIRVNVLSPGPFATEMLKFFEAQQAGTLNMLAAVTQQKRVADLGEIYWA